MAANPRIAAYMVAYEHRGQNRLLMVRSRQGSLRPQKFRTFSDAMHGMRRLRWGAVNARVVPVMRSR
jgi:hypothetical protein